MKTLLQLIVNEEKYDVWVEPWTTLLEVLRNNLGLTGSKEACGTGECGSCTVLIDGTAVNACILLALDARGKRITTIEGLTKNNELDPLQQAFIDYGAIQCGYCTPGMLLSAKALLDRNLNPTEDEVKEAISGNLCRCTGYHKIIEAVLHVSHGS
jgi:aerobic carbon-monoxide dehydrogenase small subunit